MVTVTELDPSAKLVPLDRGLLVASTLRADGSDQSSVVNAGADEQPRDRLSPRRELRVVQHLEAAAAQLVHALGRCLGVGEFELEAHLRYGDIGRPGRRTEAGLGRLCQRPDTEVFRAVDLLAGEV